MATIDLVLPHGLPAARDPDRAVMLLIARLMTRLLAPLPDFQNGDAE